VCTLAVVLIVSLGIVHEAKSAAQVLLNIVEALFVCYALDRDRQAVTNPKVHEVYSQVRTLDGSRVQCLDAAGSFLAHVAAHLMFDAPSPFLGLLSLIVPVVRSCQWAPSLSSLARAAMRMGALRQARVKVRPPQHVAHRHLSTWLLSLWHTIRTTCCPCQSTYAASTHL
jgi:hypothetical protein